MTEDRAISLAQYAFGAVGGILIWSLRKAFWAGGISSDVESRLKTLELRMERAGKLMSEFATERQGLLERNRQIFATIDQYDDLKDEIRQLRQRFDGNGNDSPFPNNRRRKP